MPRGAPSDDEWRRAGVPMAPQAHCRTPPLINLQSRDLARRPRTGLRKQGRDAGSMGTGPCRPAVTGPSAPPVRKRSTQSPRIPTHLCAIPARARDISTSLPNHRPTIPLASFSDRELLHSARPGEYQTIADSQPPLQHPVCNELPDPPKNLSSLKRARNPEAKGPFGVVFPLESVRGSGRCFEGACAACGLRRAPDDDDSEEREQHASREVVREEPEHRRVPGRGSRRLTTVETGASACRRSAGGCDRHRAALR